jgi:hypothetical protein
MMRAALLLACLSCIASAEKPSPVQILKGSRVVVVAYQRVPVGLKADRLLTAADDPEGYRAKLAGKLKELGVDFTMADSCAAASADMEVAVMLPPPNSGSELSGDLVIRRRAGKKVLFQSGWFGKFEGTLEIHTPLPQDKMTEARSEIMHRLIQADFWQNFDSMMKSHYRGSGQARWLPTCY